MMQVIKEDVQKKIDYWLQSPEIDEGSKKEIRQSISLKDKEDILSRFSVDLKFGTGGIRGIVGAGSSRMNLYTIRKTAWAIAHYFKAKYPDQQIKLAIAHDTRESSRPFAEACAEVFAAYGVKTFFSDEPRPTPLLSFMIKHYGCHGGLCLTASHNPSYYNGLKLYTSFGGQILPPDDGDVLELTKKLEKFEDIQRTPFVNIESSLLQMVSTEIDAIYFKSISVYKSQLKNKEVKIVYTPLHGAGSKMVPQALNNFGFKNIFAVKEQSNMDGNFSTLTYANPEDPNSFKMALALAKEVDADIVLANDPDADRIGIAVKEKSQEGKDYWFLNGHEIICLLTYYILSTRKNDSNDLVIKTIVTSNLMDKIADSFGVQIDETLTGFKWICGLIEQYEQQGRTPHLNYICGGEESYGFLAGQGVADKDGVSACCIAAEMFCYFQSKGQTMRQVLDELYGKHGVYREELVSHDICGFDGVDQMRKKIDLLRANPPLQISNIDVLSLKDYQSSKEFVYSDKQLLSSKEIEFPTSNVLQFILEDGSKVSVRPSGTEPKVKFYFSVFQPVTQRSVKALDEAKNLAQARLEGFKTDFLKSF